MCQGLPGIVHQRASETRLLDPAIQLEQKVATDDSSFMLGTVFFQRLV